MKQNQPKAKQKDPQLIKNEQQMKWLIEKFCIKDGET